VIIGWHAGAVLLTEIRPGYAAMQYLTALCFLLTGGGLLALALRLPRVLPVILGLLAAAIGLALCIEYLSGIRLGFDQLFPYLPKIPGQPPSRPSPPTSICFFLCGSAVALLGSSATPGAFKRLTIWVAGSLAMSLAVMALCGYVTGISGTYAWGPFIGMAIHTALGVVILSTGLLAALPTDGHTLLEDPWLPVPVAVATITAILILWQALLAERYRTVETKAAIIAADLKIDTASRLEAALHALNRMKRRWDARDGTPFEEWKADALAYLNDEKIYKAIEWVDPALHIRWIVPESSSALIGLDLAKETRWNAVQTLEKARRDRTILLSPVIDLKQGGRGFLAYLPLFPREVFDGFLVGVFQIHDLMQDILEEPEFANYSISIFEGPRLLYGPGPANPSDHYPSAESHIDFRGLQWRCTVSPLPHTIEAAESNLPHIILILGLLFCAALSVAARALQQMKQQAGALQKTNRQLEDEILARERFEAMLSESQERLRAVLDSAIGVSAIGTDFSGTITYFSKGAERLLGYSAEELVGHSSPAIFHDPGEVTQRSRELTRQLGYDVEGFEVFVAIPKTQSSERREWTYICKDGTRRTVDLTVTTLGASPTTVTGFLGTAIDITERKKMEQDLRDTVRARETAQALLEAAGRIAHLGHWELPLDGSGPVWSDITCDLHEVPPGTRVSLEEAIAFFHAQDRPTIERHIRNSMETGKPFDCEARLITARKREVWIHTRGEPMRDETGRLLGLRGVIQDIDERHRVTELLKTQNEQLKIARAQAEAHARAKAEFLANMSHEIRTPLNAVVGMSDLLMDRGLPASELELAETIRNSGEVLLALINDILDFSKIESGKLDLERIPIRLRECVESALDLVSDLAAQKNLDLVYWIDPAIPPAILGDLTRFRQILVNLTANAIKFTEKGEVFVQLSRKTSENGEDLLHVAIRDSGIGISPESLDRLFQAFSQVDASTTRRYGGTGLGLAISHRLVGMMKGRIWVDSETGKGSTFQFEIPLHPAEISPPPALNKPTLHHLEGRRILIVDDNPTNCWVLQMQTHSWGMLPVVAAGAQQALDRIRGGEPFDIAILDATMPEVDGYALTAQIRRLRSRDELPIVILASLAEQGHDLEKLGIHGMLTKPVKTASLLNMLCGALGGANSATRASPSADINEKLSLSHPLRILLAEDNPVNQRVADLLLRRLGYHAVIVANGLEALAALEQAKFDVVLLDVQMPEMDGIEAAHEICRRFSTEERPWLVALTAHALEGDREACLAAGMDAYLSKPIRSDTLGAALRRAYEHKRLNEKPDSLHPEES